MNKREMVSTFENQLSSALNGKKTDLPSTELWGLIDK